MPVLKRFANLEFLHDLHVKYLKPVLKPYAQDLKARGVVLASLADDDESARLLLSAFTDAPDQLPQPLLNDLYTLEELSTDAGIERLRDEAEKAGLTLPRGDITAGDLALHVFHHERELAERCFATTVDAQVSRFAEYAARTRKRLELDKAERLKPTLESVLAEHFDRRGFSKACFIHLYEEHGEVCFHITHGRTYRSTGTIVSGTLERSRTAFREQKYDLVIYSNRDHVIRIHTTYAKDAEKYRTVFGKVIFNDPEAFDPKIPIYDLAPLAAGRSAIAPTPGIGSVLLKEVWCKWDNGETVQRTRSRDVFRLVENEDAKLTGEIVRASFMITYESGGKSRKLEVHVPRQAIFDRARHWHETLEFLRTHGYVRAARD